MMIFFILYCIILDITLQFKFWIIKKNKSQLNRIEEQINKFKKS
jgi:hypothetical protein